MTQINYSPLKLPSVVTSLSAEDTFALGERFAAMLVKGSSVALDGPLGAGKTCFIKGIAAALGIGEGITSPSYAIICEYEASVLGERIPFYHIDAYRLDGDGDFSTIGGGDYIFGNGICVVEWSGRIQSFIPAGAYKVDIEITGDDKRLIRLYTAD